jgi:hypothetical protein
VKISETLSRDRIDMGYRLYWTKMALGWDAERRSQIAPLVTRVIHAPDFENNALERRYRVYDLDEQAHSGASILALADVLHALDKFETGDDNT